MRQPRIFEPLDIRCGEDTGGPLRAVRRYRTASAASRTTIGPAGPSNRRIA